MTRVTLQKVRGALLTMLVCLSAPVTAGVPDMICRDTGTLNVMPFTLDTWKSNDQVLLRFKSGNLYLSWPNRDEFLYNTVVEQEPGRFVSAYKTIMFPLGDKDFKSGTVVHSDYLEVRVTKINCTKALP